jgi:hypothetical protein
MKIEYNDDVIQIMDFSSSDDEILQMFLEGTMELDGDNLVIKYQNLVFDDLTVTRDVFETNIINKQYLKDTDWYVTRQAETGKPIPEDILQKRQEARDSIVENN